MNESRPAASLTASLLARRGTARPAMRRQPLGNVTNVQLHPVHDDLGWNDMGEEAQMAAMYEPAPAAVVMPLPLPVPLVSEPEPPVLAEPEPVVMAEPEQVVMIETEAEAEAAPASEFEPELEAECLPGPVADEPVSPISRQLAVLAERINAKPAAEKNSPRPAEQPDASRKAAFTLRLEPERHLRLRLLSAVSNRSAQHLLIEALDALLARHDDLADLADQVEARKAAGRA